jgi:hypothetical protein
MTSLRALCDGEYAAEAESAAMRSEDGSPRLTALYDFLDSARDALGAALGLNQGSPSSLLLEASVAASEAFPLGSPQSESLGCILGVIDGAAAEVAA